MRHVYKCCACHAKWRRRSPKFCACHENCNASSENVAKVLRLPHKATVDTLSIRLECHKAPRLPRKTTWQPAWKPSKRRRFAASPIETARPQESQRLETRHVGASKRAFRARFLQVSHCVASKSTFSYEFSYEPPNLLLQNQCFARGLRQFSSHLTKGHACHGICTLSQPWQCDSQKTHNTTRL